MPFWNKFPYTDFHELNLDWVITKIKEINNKVDNFIIDTTKYIKDFVFEWLDLHPEATTTVQNGALTLDKFNESLKNIINFKYAYKLYGSGDTAAANIARNADAEAPITLTDMAGLIAYNDFDNVIDMILGYDKYNNVSSSGIFAEISNITNNTVELINFNSLDIQPGTFITLHTGTPEKRTWKYIGQIESISGNIVTVTNWYSYDTGLISTPTGVDFAWINPLTKLYGQNISIHATENGKMRVMVASQADIYPGESNASIVGYSPVLHDGNGSNAFRARTTEPYSWNNVFVNENVEPRASLLKNVDTIVFTGDNRLGILNLLTSTNEDTKIPVHVVTENTTLQNTYKSGTVKVFYNNTDNPITITGDAVRFQVHKDNRTSYCLPARSMQAFLFLTDTICKPIGKFTSSYEWNTANNWDGDIVAITTNTNLDNLMKTTMDSSHIRKVDFYTGGSDITITIDTGSMYINGNTTANVKTATLPARTAGTIICAKSNNSYYINYGH